MRKKRVRDVMTPDLVTIGPEERLARVRELFEENGFHHLLVVEHGRLVGVISDRDLLKLTHPFVGRTSEHALEADVRDIRAGEILSRQPVTVGADESLAVAARRMLAADVTCLPVLAADGSPCGIVTVRDVLRHVVREDDGPTL